MLNLIDMYFIKIDVYCYLIGDCYSKKEKLFNFMLSIRILILIRIGGKIITGAILTCLMILIQAGY